MANEFHCRSCASHRGNVLLDLGEMPLANSYLRSADAPERKYPLQVQVCSDCLLVQTIDCVRPQEIFTDYAYFSSYSDSWLQHCRAYVGMIVKRLHLDRSSQVVEVASNDGYLLRNFVERQIPCLGIEPAANVAAAARRAGIPTETEFFGAAFARRLAEREVRADLLIANNVLAHVPDINDFLVGIRNLLKPQGVATLEFPHVLNLLREVQFDTIYHEHFSYLSLLAVQSCVVRNGLHVFDVEKVSTHGGSLRIYLQAADGARAEGVAVANLLAEEREAGLDRLATYAAFAPRVALIRDRLRAFLASAAIEGKVVAAYGAAAKGNTLLNYCGVGRAEIAFCADRSKAKQGSYLPGSRIPVVPTEQIDVRRPDYLLILPWNIKDEIVANLSSVVEWGCRFVVAVPDLAVL